ncbi:MAG: PAS domain-containing protein [Candidatus Latescibacteria bacterium]|nr:PAS domain-containing protein [Candidatus Latescibacterota bacterium]MBT4137154.1 PAS domain-containing protein [Candidatus Latescibacterota bacterium]MBT5830241.1 PAS domain-containing protein [Candidatus Latescibacterota bacterium]
MDGRVRYANPIAGEVMGCRADEMTGRFLWDIIINPTHVAHIMETTLEYGQWRGEIELNHPEEPVPLQWRSTVIQSQSGEILGTAHIGGKQISQKELLDRLAGTERQRLLGELTAGVVHSLNQVFTSVHGYASLMKLEELPPTVESNLTALIKAIENGIDVTRRIQGDRNTSQKQNGIDLNDVVKASVKTTQPKWQDEVRRRGCAVEVVLDLQANQKTRGAASLLDEVLINLIFNAADAMHSGGTLTISTWQDQDWGYVSVSDTGVGMDQETQDRIGELFFTTKPTGHGIGLATCYHLISQIGGCVQVKSTLDEGTTFTVQIPLEQSTDP